MNATFNTVPITQRQRKMKTIILPVLMVIFTSMAGCSYECISGKGEVLTQNRKVNATFDKIEIRGPIHVEASQGNDCRIEVSDYENIVDLIETSVSDNTLMIQIKEDIRVDNSQAVVYITLPELTGITQMGSGYFQTIGPFAFQDIEIDIKGSGDAVLSGNARSFTAFLAGSGDVDANELACRNANVEIMGSGNMKLNVSGSLKANIMGSGNIAYTGKPTDIQKEVQGSGEILPIE